VPGCTTDADCVYSGERCDGTNHCSSTSCPGGQSDCPANSVCTDVPGPGPLCLSKTCSTDADCDHPGWCVDGQCEDTLGMCYTPVP
jgi:hypothetical protein